MPIVYIDDFPIDCSKVETHRRENEVTAFPIETGGQITDHVTSKPWKVTIEGVVSDTPIGDMEGIRESLVTASDSLAAGATGEKTLPSRKALAKLEELDDSKRAITLITTLKTYRDMVLQSLEISVEAKKTGGLFFTASFEHATFRSLARTKVAVRSAQTGPLVVSPKAKEVIKAIRCKQRSLVTGDCTSSEVVTYDPQKNQWLHPDGKPLSDADLSSWQADNQLRVDHQAEYDKTRGAWVDSKTKQPVSKNPDRVYYEPGAQDPLKRGNLTRDYWDRALGGD